MVLRPDRLSVIIELLFISKQILRNIRSRIFRPRRSQGTFCGLYQGYTNVFISEVTGLHFLHFFFTYILSSESAL